VIMQILISQSGGLPNTLTQKLAVYLLVRASMSTRRKKLPTDVRALLRCGAEYRADAVNCVPPFASSSQQAGRPLIHGLLA
jgi:hypothetical protein